MFCCLFWLRRLFCPGRAKQYRLTHRAPRLAACWRCKLQQRQQVKKLEENAPAAINSLRNVLLKQVSDNSRTPAITEPLRCGGRIPTPPTTPTRRKLSQQPQLLLAQHSVETWEVPNEFVKIYKKIGSGSFGTVYMGFWNVGPLVLIRSKQSTNFGYASARVAVKKLNVGKPTQAQLKRFEDEIHVLKKTRHTNIVLFMGWIKEPQIAIITAWCERSSLYRHLHVIETNFSMNPLVNADTSIVEIAKQTSQGMEYLHSIGIIHRDLKSNNIFLADNWTVKIGDFGLAAVKTRWSQQSKQPTGSILWMAPEVIRMRVDSPYGPLADVYSFGIVLYELITRELPYADNMDKDMILFRVGCGSLHPEFDEDNVRDDCPKQLITLARSCFAYDRHERPVFASITTILEKLIISLPRLERSASLPAMNRQSKDRFFSLSSPKQTAVFDVLLMNCFPISQNVTNINNNHNAVY